MDNERTDNRCLSAPEQYQLRRDTAKLLAKEKSVYEIAGLLGVSRTFVYDVKARVESGGTKALGPQQRGRRKGAKRRLAPEQESWAVKTITEKSPDQLKLPCCLWDCKAVAELVSSRFGIDLPPSTMSLYLRRWGFSKQRPVKRANKQDPKRIRIWLEEEYPAIEEKARSEGAEIYWADETALQNTANFIKGYAPKGKAPVLGAEAKRIKLNMLAAMSNRGKLRFTISHGPIASDALIDFMGRLCRDSGRKVMLVLDNLRAHHSKKVDAWTRKHADRIELFFLPPYAPEYNPDEYLNSDLKRDMGRRPSAGSAKELSRSARSFLVKRQRQPEKVAGYFQHEYTKYASGLSII